MQFTHIPIILLAILSLSTLISCTSSEITEFTVTEPEPHSSRTFCFERPETCPDINTPVQGSDGNIYQNGCTACHNAEVQWFEK